MILLSNHLLKPHNTRKKFFQNAFSIIGLWQQKHRRIVQTNSIHVNLSNLLNLPSCVNHSIHVTQLTQASKQILTNNSITATPQVWQQASKQILTNNSITATSQIWQQKIIRASLAIFL